MLFVDGGDLFFNKRNCGKETLRNDKNGDVEKKNQPKSRPSGKYWIGRIRSCRRGRAALQFR